MSTEASTTDMDTPGGASALSWGAAHRSAEPPPASHSETSSKPQRVLACVLCQQRKVKCDRRFPCVNCTKAKVTCVPATLGMRKRRPRFPERHLLDRIRHYEDLLRQNDVDFEPLHKDPKAGRYHVSSTAVAAAAGDDDSDGDAPGTTASGKPSPSSTAARPEWPYKDFWQAMRRGYSGADSDDSDSELGVHEGTIRSAWDRMATQMSDSNDYLFFGSRATSVDLSTLHPGPVQIFKLWQIYLDNVNPLLKVTHSPSLQARIVMAVGDLGKIDPNLEALMFSIYCVAILSMGNDCEDVFGEPKHNLLTRYQFGCQQALLNANFLRTNNTDCLAGFLLYLISVRSKTDPASLSSLLSIALRLAQRIGIAFESGKEDSPVLDVELHRRLWWTLVLFDARVGELSRDVKTSPLALPWDARIPLNVSDSDLQPGIKELPVNTSACSDALFIVVRVELANFVRHADFYRIVLNPDIEPVDMRPGTESSLGRPKTLDALDQAIEDKYLRFCDPQIPIHYMTMWTTRSSLAKYRIMEMYTGATGQVDADTFTFWAIRWLECDTKLLTSPLTSGFGWMVNMYFPFPAYIQVLHDLKRRPVSQQAERGWEAISANYAGHIASGDDYPSLFVVVGGADNPFFQVLLKMVVISWEAREAALSQDGAEVEPPWVVTHLRRLAAESQAKGAGPPPPMLDENLLGAMDISASGTGDFQMPSAATDSFGDHGVMGAGVPMMPPGQYAAVPDVSPFPPVGRDMNMDPMGMLDVNDTSWMKYFIN